jgi:hypothetical protein
MRTNWRLKITWEQTSGPYLCGVDKKTQRRSFNLEIMFYGCPREKRWFGPFKVHYCLPNNIVFLVSINNIEPNPIILIVNKLKPYKYVGVKMCSKEPEALL